MPSGRTASSLLTKADQFVAGDAVCLRRPVAPAVRRLERGPKRLAGQLALPARDLLHVVQELQEHDPGEHRQAVEVAVEPLVLAHDVAGGLDDGGQAAGRWSEVGCSFSLLVP